MIDYDKSAILNNCSIDDLHVRFARFAKSNKKIVAICDNCGSERNIEFSHYHDLCRVCVKKTTEYRKLRSELTKKQFASQEARDAASDKGNQHYIDHPEAREAASLKTIKQFSDVGSRAAASYRRIQWCIDHPEWSGFMQGGNDMVEHHFIYDHDHPENHVVKITRSEHSAHHRWMMRNDLEVPHINVRDNNRYAFNGRKVV